MPDNISEAQRFVRDLISDWSLYNGFVGAEMQATANPVYRPEILDNFLVGQGYRTTVQDVAGSGQAVLSQLGPWQGTYATELAPTDDPGQQVQGPEVVIGLGADGPTVSVGGTALTGFTYSMLTLSWTGAGTNPSAARVVMHRAGTGSASGGPGGGASAGGGSNPPQFAGTCTYDGVQHDWVGYVGTQPGTRARTPGTFLKVVQIIDKVVGAINQALMVAQLIHSAYETYLRIQGIQGQVQRLEPLQRQLEQAQAQVEQRLASIGRAQADIETTARQIASAESTGGGAAPVEEQGGTTAQEGEARGRASSDVTRTEASDVEDDVASGVEDDAAGDVAGEVTGDVAGDVVGILADLCCCA
ncbi:MAG TPA: hypothetical protein VGC13_00425 [Longimicrobium sp.]|jgi:hypothetical protein|uniref:hypothetical protein n=1 Tax=Longimicrobium sp. TaxID=2029185 RepID=UPI002EDB4A2C